MSKQNEAKKAQNYRDDADTCANCTNYRSELIEKTYDSVIEFQVWTEEKGKRCALGGFAVKKTATCDQHVLVLKTEALERNRS